MDREEKEERHSLVPGGHRTIAEEEAREKGDRKAVTSNYTARFIIYRWQFLLARGESEKEIERESHLPGLDDRSMICAAASRIRRRSIGRHRSPGVSLRNFHSLSLSLSLSTSERKKEKKRQN